MAKKMELEKAYDEASKANTIQECQTILCTYIQCAE